MRSWARGCIAIALISCCTSCDAGGEAPAPGRAAVNVLWVSVDTLRADRLSCYGNQHQTSPAIDQLAAEGVLFERAFSTSSWTLPAHVSMFTGLPMSVHGVCHHEYEGAYPARGIQVPELLQQNGWRTGGFYTHAYLKPKFGFGVGFGTWERADRVHNASQALRTKWESARAAGRRREARELAREHAAVFDYGAPEADYTVDRALEWLGEASTPQPFFLFVHLFDVHSPYRPPPPFDQRFGPVREGAERFLDIDAPDSPLRAGAGPEVLRDALALYDGEIAWIDSQVARLLERLDELGVADNTLVILTSDHGEEFLEHGGTGHRRNVYTESVHVPLILRLPRSFEGGRRAGETTSLIDLAPTVLAACGVPLPRVLPGVDLRRLSDPDYRTNRTLISELVRVEDGRPTAWTLALIGASELVVVHQAGSPEQTAERFDLTLDPRGAGPGDPISPDGEAWITLDHTLEGLRKRFTALRAAQPPAAAAGSRTLDELEEGALGALGYGGFDLDSQGTEEGRLCMDGCVWGG